MSARTVFLHIGEPKSGTTFVQQVMWANRGELARRGVVLPGVAPHDHFRANQDLREEPQDPDDPTASWRGEWDLLARQAVQAERTAVISHEKLAGATAEQAARAIASVGAAEVHVVVSLRDFASVLPTEWQETVKHRNPHTWEQWINRVMTGDVSGRRRMARWFWRAHDTLEILRRWTPGIPPEHVHVVTMPRPGAPRDLLWQRFAGVLGVDPAGFDLAAARPNASLGLAEIEMLRRLNIALRDEEVPAWFYSVNVKEHLAHEYLPTLPNEGRPVLGPEHAAWARERCERTVAGLRAAGYRVAGDLDELLPRDTAPTSGGDTAAVPTERVLDAAIGALARALHNQYDPPPVQRPDGGTAGDRVAARVAASPALKRTIRELSAKHPSVARARVAAWRLTERARARRG